MRRLPVILSVLALALALGIPAFAQTTGNTVHTVAPGENLFRIALRYNTTTAAIASANGITNTNLIFVGQQLIIPTGSAPAPAPAPGATPVPAPAPAPAPSGTYTVQPGDTLNSIAVRHGTTYQAIASANNLANPNLIFPGMQLNIPGATGPAPAPAPGPAPAPAPSGTYTVQPGDTLSSIAARFGTTYQAIAAANGITNPNLIFPGLQLTIPGSTAPGGPPAPAPSGPPPATGGFELGGQVLSFAYPSQMRGAGMSWAKIQLTFDRGASPEVARGAIDAAHSNGFRVLLSIKGHSGDIAGNPSQYYQDFANFLQGVAAIGPDAIEVWNEQNIDREWPSGLIGGQQYVQMLSAAYQAIKRGNSNVMVISGAPAPTGFFGGCSPAGCDDDAYIRQMANAGAAQFADCVGIHYNEGILPPTATSGDPRGNSGHYTRYFPSMVNVYASAFPSKPLCFTELGYLSPEGLGALPAGFAWAANVTVQDQALWLRQAAEMARSGGRVRLMIVWNIDATEYGADPQAGYAIVRRDSNTCPACVTLGALMGSR